MLFRSSWAPPVCACVVREESPAEFADLETGALQSIHALPETPVANGKSVVAGAMPQGLYGVLEGDPQAHLDALTQQAQAGQVLEIACGQLIRVDFVAAGSILNWAAELQNQGYSLRFTQLHQLVAAFFFMIGIQEHAKLQVRST